MNDLEITSTTIDIGRLEEEEEALRAVSPIDGAFGRNASDYHNMWAMFQQIINRASAMNSDPTAFMTHQGRYDEKTLSVWVKMLGTAHRILEGLNKARNSDRLTAYILEKHTRDYSSAIAVELGRNLQEAIDATDDGDMDELKERLFQLLHVGIPDMFVRAANKTLAGAKEEFGLLQ